MIGLGNIFSAFFGNQEPEREIEKVDIIEDLSPEIVGEEVIEDWTEGNPNKVIVTNYEYLYRKISR